MRTLDREVYAQEIAPFARQKQPGSGIGGILPSMLELNQENLIILRSSSIDSFHL